VAAPTNSQRIDALLEVTSALKERMQAIRRDLDDLRKDMEGASSQIHQLDTRLARIEEALKHSTGKLDKLDPTDRLIRVEEGLKNVAKELDGLRSSRFEIGKLILAAILGGAVAFGFNLLTEIIKTMRVDSRVQKPRP